MPDELAILVGSGIAYLSEHTELPEPSRDPVCCGGKTYACRPEAR